MNRTRKMQIMAVIALFAIMFSVVSTALLIILSSFQPQEVKLEDFMVQTGTTDKTGGIEVTLPEITSTGTIE